MSFDMFVQRSATSKRRPWTPAVTAGLQNQRAEALNPGARYVASRPEGVVQASAIRCRPATVK
jgi:hypothetical protein